MLACSCSVIAGFAVPPSTTFTGLPTMAPSRGDRMLSGRVVSANATQASKARPAPTALHASVLIFTWSRKRSRKAGDYTGWRKPFAGTAGRMSRDAQRPRPASVVPSTACRDGEHADALVGSRGRHLPVLEEQAACGGRNRRPGLAAAYHGTAAVDRAIRSEGFHGEIIHSDEKPRRQWRDRPCPL